MTDRIPLSNGLFLIKDEDNLFSSGWKFSGGVGGQYTMDWLISMYGEEKAKETYKGQEAGKLKIVKEYLTSFNHTLPINNLAEQRRILIKHWREVGLLPDTKLTGLIESLEVDFKLTLEILSEI